jgi:hypothetical protein
VTFSRLFNFVLQILECLIFQDRGSSAKACMEAPFPECLALLTYPFVKGSYYA